MEGVKSLEDWAKTARAQVGTFSHGRGESLGFLSRGREAVRWLEDLMLRRRGAEMAAATLLALVLLVNHLRGRAACRRVKRAGHGL